MKAIIRQKKPSKLEQKKKYAEYCSVWIFRTLRIAYIALSREFGFSNARLKRFQREFQNVFGMMHECGKFSNYKGNEAEEVNAMYDEYLYQTLDKLGIELNEEGIISTNEE